MFILLKLNLRRKTKLNLSSIKTFILNIFANPTLQNKYKIN